MPANQGLSEVTPGQSTGQQGAPNTGQVKVTTHSLDDEYDASGSTDRNRRQTFWF